MTQSQESAALTPLASRMEKRIRVAAVLLIIGLLIEVISLQWAHPTAFLVFAFIGGAFIGLGILIFLFSLVSLDTAPEGSN